MGYMPVEKLSLKMIIIMIFPLENAPPDTILYKKSCVRDADHHLTQKG